MKASLLAAAIALYALALSYAADPECVYREYHKLGKHWPNPTDCSRYFRCSAKNTKREIICPIGKEYNQKTGKCSPIGRGYCKLSLTKPVEGEDNVCANEVSGAFVRDPGYCRSFYICYNGLAYLQSCDSGSRYDDLNEHCVPDPDDVCWENKCIGESDGTTLALEDSCLSYLTCQGGEATQETCPAGQYFDVNTLSCETGTCPSTDEPITEPTTEPTTDQTTQCPQETTAVTVACTCPGGYAEGDFVPHNTNCMLYYICSEGSLVESSCGTGNYFDQETNSCQRDVNGVCVDCQTTRQVQRSLRGFLNETHNIKNSKLDTCFGLYYEGQFISHPNDCQKFLICKGGVLTVHDCGENNYYDSDTHSCEADSKHKCSLRKQASSQSGLETNCFGSFYDGQIISHPNSCRRYLICDSGHLTEFNCGRNHYYNATLEACTLDVDGICPLRTIETMQLPAHTDIFKPVLDPADCGETGITCPGGYTNGQVIPIEDQCSKYSICVNGVIVEESCQKCYLFNANSLTCDLDEDHSCWPLDSECGGSGGETSICDGQPDETKLANPVNCATYYLCFDNEGIEMPCYEGEFFNTATGACEPDTNAVCINPCAGIAGPLTIATDECDKFYYCLDGTTTVETCEVGGFDVITGTCQEDAICVNTMCKNQQDGYTFPVVGDPSKFYYCLDGVAIQDTCPEEKEYDEELMQCISQPSSDCDQSVCSSSYVGEAFPPISGDNPSAFCICVDGAAYKRYCDNDYVFDSSLGICYSNAPCDPLLCEYSPEYTVSVDRADENSFCLCVSQTPVIVECPSNGIFNPVTLLCQVKPEESANCDSTYCLSQEDYTIFEALNGYSGFCYCLANIGVYRPCDTNTIFDPDLELCLPTSSNCDATYCVNQADYTLFSSLTGNSGFCYCYGNSAVYKACSTGTTYDPDIGICTPTAVRCDITDCSKAIKGKTYPIPAIGNAESFCYCLSSSNMLSLHCEIGKTYSEPLGICIDSSVAETVKLFASTKAVDTARTCAGGFEHGQFIPNLLDCQRFYICAYGTLSRADCGTGNYFNKTLNACAWDRYGSCAANKEVVCDGNVHEGDFISIPQNKRFFYVCYNGRLEVQDCGENKYFDTQHNVCRVNLTGFDSRRQRQRSISSFIDANSVNSASQEFDVCLNGRTRLSSTNCTQYEICLNGTWRIRICPPQTFYSTDKQACMENYECEFLQSTFNLQACTTEIDQQLRPDMNGDCQVYYACSNGIWQLLRCPQSQHYSSRLRTCITSADSTICRSENETQVMSTNKTEITTSSTSSGFENSVQGVQANMSNNKTWTDMHTVSEQCQHMTIRYYMNNCAMYLICLESEWWYQYCPLGMYFDRTINYCTPITQPGQCESASRNISVSTETLTNHDDFTKQQCLKEGTLRESTIKCDRYYVCSGGTWYVQYCRLAHYFNKTSQMCEPLPIIADAEHLICVQLKPKCAEHEVRVFPYNCTAYEQCIEGQWTRQDCTTGNTFDDVTLKCVPNDGTCASNGLRRVCHENETRQYPLPSQCSFFYYCNQDSWIVGQCLSGHTFDLTTGHCAPHITNDKCKIKTTQQEVIDNELSSNANNEISPCQGRTNGTIVPHASDCNRYYVCSGDAVVEIQQCANGSYFDSVYGYCRFDQEGVCKSVEYSPDLFVNNTITCTNSTHGKRFSHPEYCNLFYSCVRGIVFKASCTSEEVFNDDVGSCLLMRNNTESCARAQLDRAVESAPNCTQLSDGAYVPDLNDCTRFYICMNGQTMPQQCATGAYYDSQQHLCAPDDGACPYVAHPEQDEEVVIIDPPLSDTVCEGKHGLLLADATNCNNFYVCINGKLRYETCDDGYYFNSSRGECQSTFLSSTSNATSTALAHCNADRNNLVELCTLISYIDTIAVKEDCRRYIKCQREVPTPKRCYNGEFYDSLLGFCRQNDNTCLLENGERVGECSGRHGELISDLNDCTRFYTCVNGQAIPQQCATGLYYDSQQHSCLPNNGACLNVAHLQKIKEVIIINPPLSDTVCEDQDGLLLADVTNCNNFYVCINGKLRYETCDDGYYFNASRGECQSMLLSSISNATSTALAHCNANRNNLVELCDLITHIDSMAVKGDCRRYIKCQGEVPTPQRCYNGEFYDSLLGFCRQNDNTCLLENGERVGECSGRHGELIPNTENCRGYFVCVNEQKIERTCAQNEYFHQTNHCQPDISNFCHISNNQTNMI